jgi:hypothetical protein
MVSQIEIHVHEIVALLDQFVRECAIILLRAPIQTQSTNNDQVRFRFRPPRQVGKLLQRPPIETTSDNEIRFLQSVNFGWVVLKSLWVHFVEVAISYIKLRRHSAVPNEEGMHLRPKASKKHISNAPCHENESVWK